jgi:splicing factor 4
VLQIVYSAGEEGLGSERRGHADPVMAGEVKNDHLGVGPVQPGEVTSEDDIYEQYKKRMMLYWLPLPASRNSLLFLFP